jgi:4-amino-4-deoxy-L-arabinose transferase-like glycosyltransferase
MTTRTRSSEWLIVGGLLVLSLALRLGGLGQVPPGVRFDELVNVQMADHIYAGEWPIYFQEAWGHEPLYHYFHALGMTLLGQTVLGVRITSVLFGTLGVLTTYLVMRRLFGRMTAAIAGLMLATSFWSLLYSRVGLRHISLPPWVCLAAYFFWRGLETPAQDRKRVMLWFVLGGASTGVMLYTYFASRVVPAIWAMFAVYLLIFNRERLRGRWLGLLLSVVIPALIVTPMVLYLRQHPELEQRLGQVGSELLGALRAGDAQPLLSGIVSTSKMFSLYGDPEWLYNISGRPVFDPVTSVAFCAGLGLSLWHWRDPRRALLVLWLIIGISPSLLSWPPGSLGHTIVAQPAAMGIAALGLTDVLSWAERRSSRWLVWTVRVLAAATLVIFCSVNSYDYFHRWPRLREVRHEYQAPITAAARYVQAHPERTPTCVSAPYVDYWNPWSKMNFDLYAGEDGARVRWFDGGQSILFPAEGQALFVLPDHLLLPSALDPDLWALLIAGAQPIEVGIRDRTGTRLDIYRWHDPTALEERLTSVAAAPVWASPETVYVAEASEAQREPLPLPLNFGHRVALLGHAVERDTAAGGEAWRMTTYWRVLDADSGPLAIFVHVLDDANGVRTGWDGLYVSTESWKAGDVFIHTHTLALPADLPPGKQRVEIGVYSPVTLDRLALFTGEGETTAPYDRALLPPLMIE